MVRGKPGVYYNNEQSADKHNRNNANLLSEQHPSELSYTSYPTPINKNNHKQHHPPFPRDSIFK